MKIIIGDLIIENVVSTSTSDHIDIETTLENASQIYNTLKEKGTFTVDFIGDDNNVSGEYADKVIKKMEYENGVATIILRNADLIVKQVEQNKADIEYIRLMQDL